MRKANPTPALPGKIWISDFDSYGFIKYNPKILETMNSLGIKQILIGNEVLSNSSAIANRAPHEISYYQSQVTVKYNSKVERAEGNNISLYNNDPSIPYAHQAELDMIANAGLVIDPTLLIIPPVPAGSVSINPSVRDMTNRKLFNARTAAERGTPLGGVFIENAAQQIFTTVAIRGIAHEYAKLEMRAHLPDPTATIDTIKLDLSIDQINDAMTKFANSESTKEESTNRLMSTNINAQHFFDVCLGSILTAPICGQEIKEQKWHEAWKKLQLHFTKQTTSSNAAKRFESELKLLSYNDPSIYASQTIDNFMQNLLELEVNSQLAQQMSELHPPMQIIPPSTIPTVVPTAIWHMTTEELIRELHSLPDNQIQATHPHAIIYKRSVQRLHTVLDKLAPQGSLNENFKNSFLEEVNEGKTAATINNFVTRLKFVEQQRPLDQQQLTTTLLVKSKVVAVNNVNAIGKLSAANNNDTQPKPKKHCKTCEKHRPNARLFGKGQLLQHTHNTSECFKEHGVMYNKQQDSGNSSKSSITNSNSSKKRDNSNSKATDSGKKGGSGKKKIDRKVTIAKRVKAEAKVSDTDGDADAEESDDNDEDINTNQTSHNEDNSE